MDKRYKLMRKIAVTHAAVADTTVFEPLLDRANTSGDVYADRGYPTAEREAKLKQDGWRVYPAQRQRHQRHRRYTKEAQPPYRHTARRIMYTTNAIESLNMQVRKVIKNRATSPTTRQRQN